MVNYIILYNKFEEHHVIKLILLKISKLSARLTIGSPKIGVESFILMIWLEK